MAVYAKTRKRLLIDLLHENGICISYDRVLEVSALLGESVVNQYVESDASQKCLDINNYDKSMCSMYFQRYKNCRKYWHGIMVQRRRDGVRPDMPTAAEREEMLTALGGKPY
ncbi:coiled-coil-helix-coiled-coil-helix domain-containing protein 7-like [Cololabis saira]|uniref:coiled-coil-helix-coiled-coil-helix domain-containing protein 7-like n=1 Tax=Cololabis saira TaxID=129043 RepID=UPI002AD5A457|nr:coiled-coil-helix-coiled-coil-helix domain-containing protein 7-like [Cololabis saira]